MNLGKQHAFFLIKPDALIAGVQWQILQAVQGYGFEISTLQIKTLNTDEASLISRSQAQSEHVYKRLIAWYTSFPSIAGIAFNTGTVDGIAAMMRAKTAIRERFSIDTVEDATRQERAVHNRFHCSDSFPALLLESVIAEPSQSILSLQHGQGG